MTPLAIAKALRYFLEETTDMSIAQWKAIPLVRSFISIDTNTGNLVRHEVRRDTDTGLTLTVKFPID